MNVKNRKCIRKLSLKSLYANRRRNLIAIFAIALTTLLFTSMFTIVLSLNASYETYQFRQVGGYAHGTFKDVSPEQAERIAAHPKVKAVGARKVIGITAEGVFSKTPAEISYMDANCTKWSYATPTTGRMPESGKEVAMDTAALQLLGVTPELGAEVTVSYSITDKDQTAFTITDTFTLVGYWEYDELMPVHYINISRDYADDIEAQAVKTGLQPFRTDLNVMLASGTNIQGQMEQVDTDLGYTWDSYTDPNSVRIGVNWGYTSSQLESQLDPELMVAIAAFLLLVIFTGYLIIYNIFQISVAGACGHGAGGGLQQAGGIGGGVGHDGKLGNVGPGVRHAGQGGGHRLGGGGAVKVMLAEKRGGTGGAGSAAQGIAVGAAM